MTRQSAEPLVHMALSATYRRAQELARMCAEDIDLNPPYQRGDVWTLDQRIALVHSWLTGVPIGTVILNDRTTRGWEKANGSDPMKTGEPIQAVIDGRQRITTARMWFDSEFAIPASWIDPEYVETIEETTDGAYVRHKVLTRTGRNMVTSRALLQVAEAKVATVEEEAAIYLLVNGAGIPQTEADMANAAAAARKES